MTIELRAFPARQQSRMKAETRSNGELHLTGYAAVFYDGTAETQFPLYPGVVERIMPGAFTEAIARDDVACLFNHEPSEIFGRSSAGTLTLTEDRIGLFYDCLLNPNSADAKELAERINRGDVHGSSFGFSVYDGQGKQSWTYDVTSDDVKIEVRNIEKVTLYDVGPVTFACYAAATTEIAKRSLDGWRKEQRSRSRLISARLAIARATR